MKLQFKKFGKDLMYKPKLQYIFCPMRDRSLWMQLSLIKYLNSFGQEPYLVFPRPEDKLNDKIIENTLSKAGALYQDGRDIVREENPDYDVMFSESSGSSYSFEKRHLIESKRKNKINIKLNVSISINRSIINTHYTPDKTKDTLSGIYMKGQRTIDHFKTFTKDLFFINTGDPDWDIFNTNEFKEKIKQTRKKYGKKFLLLGISFSGPKQEIIWCERAIERAITLGITPVVRVHSYRERFVPDSLRPYVDLETPRFVLFAAASHVIENIGSTMIAECLYLNRKVGVTGLIGHFGGYGEAHVWFEKYNEWKMVTLPRVGKEIFNIVPRAVTVKEIDKFLSDNNILYNEKMIDDIFGWKRVPSYCSQLFSKIEKKIK